jgi:hypothetical protein
MADDVIDTLEICITTAHADVMRLASRKVNNNNVDFKNKRRA